ncbi:hypothetical protein ACFVYV_14925 [Streptomyces mirabilis]|uniref:hypothetical protein n=1 Tax=Streptomyces mirabilis TaxID=68239 RepID=UPI0036D77937
MPSVEQQFSGFLLLLDRFQKQLAEFMLGAYLACDFGSDSGDDGDSDSARRYGSTSWTAHRR